MLAGIPAALLAQSNTRKKIALIITEYRQNSHADVIGTRLLEGYEYYGKRLQPRVQVTGMFTDQVPWNDMSREKAAKNGVRIYETVHDALTQRTGKLAVDGVVIIGEHGAYPYNEKGQHLYPRYELFSQVVEVFKASNRAVPVFCDKHLSYDWKRAKWMYDQSKLLKFSFLAGSSLPVAWRRPELELPVGAPLKEAVVAFHGGIESYGFHALETLQCMAERRKGGETGIRSVQCIEGPDAWKWTDSTGWAGRLLDAAVQRSETRETGDLRANVRNPALFLLDYQDGFRAAVYMINGHIRDFDFAGQVEGRAQPDSTLFWLQPGRFYSHFCGLTHYIEEMIVTGRPAYPVERTLMTTGALAALMDSVWLGHRKIDTPHLEFSYSPPKQPLYNRGAVPALEKKGA